MIYDPEHVVDVGTKLADSISEMFAPDERERLQLEILIANGIKDVLEVIYQGILIAARRSANGEN
jgi:hypothetical protein